MKTMHFPKEYKKVLQRGRKNMTIRTHDEVGKYEKGQVYQATDYRNNPLNIEIKILDVNRTIYKKIKKFLPKTDRKRLNLDDDAKVDVARFVPTNLPVR